MEFPLLLWTLFFVVNGALATKLCEEYKRPLKESTQLDSVSRKFMNCWGNEVEHGQSDLIILVDKSGSMGPVGWNSALDFVDSLLTEVRVAFNATRIAVGTFASDHKVDINYLLNPSPINNKCR